MSIGGTGIRSAGSEQVVGLRWHRRLEHDRAAELRNGTRPLSGIPRAPASNNWWQMKSWCAPGGKPVVASWDRSFFYVSDPNTYPSSYGVGDPNPFSAGWSLDYASSNPNFLVGIDDWWGTEQSGYSTDGGQTWNVFPTMPSFAGNTIGGTIAASSPTDIVWAPADGFAPVLHQGRRHHLEPRRAPRRHRLEHF